MSQFKKAVCMGLLLGILGAFLLPLTSGLEEDLGLGALFRLRGPRPVPPEVTIVAIDRLSADAMGLPPDPAKWPRSLHARLIDALVQRGAVVIAFDIVFDAPGNPAEDTALDESIRRAGNVILAQGLSAFTLNLDDGRQSAPGLAKIEKLVSPAPPLDSSALALAPFPLPKIPVKVSQYWRIKPEAGDVATLPVVAFQIWALPAWQDFMKLLQSAGLASVSAWPPNPSAVTKFGSIQGLIQNLRHQLAANRQKYAQIRSQLAPLSEGAERHRNAPILKALLEFYAGERSSYLNYYGPPGSIPTVCYCDLIKDGNGPQGAVAVPDLRGQAVFVGLSERTRLDQKDGFNTVFSLPSGIDISGVEIAATAFANLVENRPVRPLDPGSHFAFILLWGVVMGFFCRALAPAVSAPLIVAAGALYMTFAYQQFKLHALWFPLVLPLLVLCPAAYILSLAWQYVESNRERRNIRQAARYYLPQSLVERLGEHRDDPQTDCRQVYGVCLVTDAAQYTTLSERLSPRELSQFMNAYYAVLFEPVRKSGGIISDVVGDSMLALWTSPQPEIALRAGACNAALEIARAVTCFNRESNFSQLPTRIGLHAGGMALGTIGAGDHYEYAPVGDVVNTASRIEGLNKYLKTKILASEEVVRLLEEFWTRELGAFVFLGKTLPVHIYELIGMADTVETSRRETCELFSQALAAYRDRKWPEAMARFRRVRDRCAADGPAMFYERLCERFIAYPPQQEWDGSISMDRK